MNTALTAPPAFYRYSEPSEAEKDNLSPEEIRASISVKRVMQEIGDVNDILAGRQSVPRANGQKKCGLNVPEVMALKIRNDSAFRLLDKLLPNLKSVDQKPSKQRGLIIRRLDGSEAKPGDSDYEEEQE